MCIYMDVRKFGPFQLKKSGHSYTFFFKKRDAYHIPGGAEKGAIWHAHPYFVIYRVPPSEVLNHLWCMIC